MRGAVPLVLGLVTCAPALPGVSSPVPLATPVELARGLGAEPARSVPIDSSLDHAEAVAPEPARADPFEMTFVGDVIFGRYRPDGFDPIVQGEYDVFAAVAERLGSHLAVANLETPLVDPLPEACPSHALHCFGASAQMAQHLARAGFDAVSVSNNHAYDMRRAGLEQTPKILAELGLVGLGSVPERAPAVRVQTIEREGWRVGFIAVATRLNGPKPRGLPSIPLVATAALDDEVVPLVMQARAHHDLVVVLVHWGEEYRATPTSAQRRMAHELVDAGVDVVVGHHPHVLQGIERYGDGVIAYSMGNFLFDNPSEAQCQSAILRVRFRGDGCLDEVVVHPVSIERVPVEHPVPATGARGERVRRRIRTLSEPWGVRWTDDGDSLALDAPRCARTPGPSGRRGSGRAWRR